jgi:hypothetical protein
MELIDIVVSKLNQYIAKLVLPETHRFPEPKSLKKRLVVSKRVLLTTNS